ncbi:MAG: cytochrome P450, partial [Crocinitomicaceae bacterium]
MAITIKQLPGPKGYPIVGSALSIDISNMHNQIEELAAEYGPVFRLKLVTNSLIIVTDTDIVQHILKDRPEGFIRMSKVDRILRRQGVHGVFNAEGEDWKQHRRVVTKGLDVKHQKAFFDKMLVTVERLHKKWNKDADEGKIIDIQQDFLRFTVDITTSLAFGYDMNTIEEQGGVVQDHLEKIFPMIFKRINDPIQWHLLVRSKKDKAYDKALEEIYKYIDQFISDGKQRLADNPELYEKPTNCLEAILVEAESEEGFDDEEVKGNLMTLLLAGQDTTAHTLAWSIFLLTKDSKYQDALRAEADQLLGEDAWITDYDSTNLYKYTEALAYETMRVKPVA